MKQCLDEYGNDLIAEARHAGYQEALNLPWYVKLVKAFDRSWIVFEASIVLMFIIYPLEVISRLWKKT